ncbi:MAG: diguanylate cyclase, partial [Solirubrobacteraceae bacterium]
LDDFGTGYSSLGTLQRFPLDLLKLDRTLITSLDEPKGVAVVRAAVELGKALGVDLIAEGIETPTQLATLRKLKCPLGQGYLFARPLPVAQAQHLINRPDQPATAGPRRADLVTDRLPAAFGDALRAGDPHAAAGVVDDALGSGLSSVEIQSRVIAPAMWGIGELWQLGQLTIADEHLATAVSHHVLARLYPGLLAHARRRSDTVLVAAVHGEHHVLGLRMVADVFEGAGYDVRFLGADVPESSLTAWVSQHHPTIVALGATMPLNAATLARQLQALRDHDPELVLIIGGQGVPAVLRESAGVLYVADTEQLAELANSGLNIQPGGELPRSTARGGVHFNQSATTASDATEGLAARLAQTTAATADVARSHARRAFALEQLASSDPLTELCNRRAFDDRHQALIDTQGSRPPTILMIDIDRFKAINDDYGHHAGDRALTRVTAHITQALRPVDFVARYGADEFVVLLPDTPPAEAAEIAERIRSQVEHDPAEPKLTVSIGITVPDHADRRRATLDVDRALYDAKQHGRNQIVFAS